MGLHLKGICIVMGEEIKITQVQQKIITIVMGVVFLLGSFLLAKETAEYVNSVSIRQRNLCVVIDAGHGGNDPGKIGINGALEKDINLEIAYMVKQFLEASDVKVVMTREGDAGLYDENSSNKKVEDMKRRIQLIDETAPVLTVSIHQNSYSEEYVHGAQVFYYNGSEQGEKLADFIQKQLVATVDSENTRQIKANDSYYLLKKTGIPIVIVECGFLSNSIEAEKLTDKMYQEKIAWAIHLGILQYLNSTNG